jgi:hypothetical protein
MRAPHDAKSGVRLAADFRENLIIDRHDPVFSAMRAGRRKHLRSANSEDALTWNVFRSLRQIQPTVWLPELYSTAFRGSRLTHTEHATIELWQPIAPPPALLLDGDEGESEIDVVIETPTVVWFLEARLGSDISLRTTARAERDQVLRHIDMGSYYAGTRKFCYSLLVADEDRSSDGVAAVRRYADPAVVRETLAEHRPDGLTNLVGVSVLRWSEVAEILADAAEGAGREDERAYAQRALAWMMARQVTA